jgi:drug/metabolite transporter (DMT)-like permease
LTAVARAVPTRAAGVLIVGTGVLLLSPDSLFVRLLSVDFWTLIFWRGICTALGYFAVTRVLAGRQARQSAPPAARPARRSVRARCAIYALTVIGNLCFVTSVTHTSAAETLVIFASAPVFGAVITSIFRLEPISRRTWLSTSVVLVGVATIVVRPGAPLALTGDVTAIAGAIALASLLVIIRHSGTGDVVPTLAFGALLTAVVAAPFAHVLAVDPIDALVLVGGFGITLPLSLSLVMRGPRYLPAPEVSLIMLLETAVGPLWIWLALGERPPLEVSLVGGVIVGTLAVSALFARRDGEGRTL